MPGYTKLFNSILASTIWRSSDKTRIVWITLLAMADKDGIAEGSVPGLADFARVSLKDCQAAILELESPDEWSRSPEHGGRRIESIEGVGWRLLNHAKYRAKMSADERREYNRKKQAEWRERKKVSTGVIDSQSQSAMSAHTEAAPEAKASPKKKIEPTALVPDGTPEVESATASEDEDGPVVITPEDLAEAWNTTAKPIGLPLVREVIGSRRKKALLRIHEHPDEDFWRAVFSALPRSRFLTGQANNGKGSHATWRASFGWLIENDTNATKVAEGQYA